MAERNTTLRRTRVDAPGVLDKQALLTYLPVGSIDTPGVFKPDGEQFTVDADGTLHVNEKFVTRILDVMSTPLPTGDVQVDIVLSNGVTETFTVPQGPQGVPAALLTRVITGVTPNTNMTISLSLSDVNRKVSIDEYILATVKSLDSKSYLVYLQVVNTNYTASSLQISAKITTIVETTGARGYGVFVTSLPLTGYETGEGVEAAIKFAPNSDKLKAGDIVISSRDNGVVLVTGFHSVPGLPDERIYTYRYLYTLEGKQGDPGVSISSIVFDSEVADGYRYKITLSNDTEQFFVAPKGPEGPTGAQGEPFAVKKIYSSIAAMNADFNNTDVKVGQFVIISTPDIDNPENARLYVKDTTAYSYITDMSGATGIQGPKGDPGSTLSIHLGMDGVIEAGRVVFTVQDADSYLYARQNLQQFLVSMYLPIVGTLTPTMPVAITFGDTTYNLYSDLIDSKTPLTIGDLMSVSSYDTENGYFFNCEMKFLQNSDFHGFVITPPAVMARQLEKIIPSNDSITVTLSTDNTKLEFHLSAAIVQKLQRMLVTPMTKPAEDELVGIGADGTQQLVELGNTLKKLNDVLNVDEDQLHAIRYDKAQTLTDEQKAQARSNIGAGEGGSGGTGSYADLQDKPRVTTTNSGRLEPTGLEELGPNFNLHKISKTGTAADLITDATHRFVSDTEKSKWSGVDDKINKVNGTATGTLTMEMAIADGLRLNNMLETDDTYKYVVVTDANGNMKKRERADFNIEAMAQSDVDAIALEVFGV